MEANIYIEGRGTLQAKDVEYHGVGFDNVETTVTYTIDGKRHTSTRTQFHDAVDRAAKAKIKHKTEMREWMRDAREALREIEAALKADDVESARNWANEAVGLCGNVEASLDAQIRGEDY